MKIVFFGTPDYVLPVLKTLNKFHEIVAVVTQSPKPVGRKQFISYSAVDAWAHKHKIPVFYDLEKVPKADLGVLAAYGKIVPEFVIRNLKFGILNIHPSLLPKWRGASPVQATLVSGESVTGATIIILDEKIDHGPIVSQFKEAVLPSDTTETLRTRLFERAAQVLVELIPTYIQGKIKPRPQEDKEATFTSRITKEDGFIPPTAIAAAISGSDPVKGPTLASWEMPFMKDGSHNSFFLIPDSAAIGRFIRAMDPWPGSWTHFQLTDNSELMTKRRLKILKAHLESSVTSHKSLVLDQVQLEGKNPVFWEEFKRGYPDARFV